MFPLDETLDDKVDKMLALLQAQADIEKQKTLDRQENTRQTFRGTLPQGNNEPELATGSIPTSSSSSSGLGFDGNPPPLPPPTEPPGFPPGPVPALPLPPEPSFLNGPRRAAREAVERGRSPPTPGGPPPIPQANVRAPPVLPRVPSSSGSASTRSGGPGQSSSNSGPSSSSGSRGSGYRAVTPAQLESRGRATIAVMQRRGQTQPSAPAEPKRAPRRRRTRMDTPEPPRYRPYSQ